LRRKQAMLEEGMAREEFKDDYNYQQELMEDFEREKERLNRRKDRFLAAVEEWAFREPIGSIIKYENRTLEFIKFLCHALSLDHQIREEIRIMKKNCLKLLHLCFSSPFLLYVFSGSFNRCRVC